MPVTYSYPLSLPSSPAPVSVTLGIRTTHAINRSPFTGKAQIQYWTGEHWAASITLPPLAPLQAREWQAFAARLNGVDGTFLFGDPLYQPRGAGNASGLVARVNGPNQSGTTIATDGWAPNRVNVLMAGDYIQLGARLHMVLGDVSASGSGTAILEIAPRLRESPADDTQILIGSGLVGTFRLASNELLWALEANRTMGLSFEAEEAI